MVSSVAELQSRIVDTLSPIARKLNLAMEAFGKDIDLAGCPMQSSPDKAGKIILANAYNFS